MKWPWGEHWKELDRVLADSFAKVRGDIHLVFSWINYLKEKDMAQEQRNEQTSYLLGKMTAELNEVKAELAAVKGQMSQGQVRTPERTSQGQVKDKSMIQIAQERTFAGTEKLRGSQLEVLHLLYDADRPLGYGEIAKRLNKSEKSIRNIIYELRSQDIAVKDKPIGLREKGFFLDAETKIGVSGR